MPCLSAKKVLQRELFKLFVSQLSSKGLTDSTLELLCIYKGLKEQRYINSIREIVPKSNWALSVLPELDDQRFWSYTQVGRPSFDRIVDLIQHNDIFGNMSTCAQAPIELQLHYALFKLGHEGNANSIMKTATTWGVSDGHIVNCTWRVVQALCRIRDDFIKWSSPHDRQRESLKNDEREGFVGAVGKIDGTDVVSAYKPDGDYHGESFYSRKNKYALDICAVCNSWKEFTYYLAGWANSQHDSCIFASTTLCRNPESYFDDGQFLLGDAAYTNSNYLISPYKAPASRKPENWRFNRKLSAIRIDIEHALEMLKGRWKSLTGLRILIHDQASYKYAVQWITACLVLHNILLSFRDEWDECEGWWSKDKMDEHVDDLDIMTRHQRQSGIDKKKAVKAMVLGIKWWDYD